MRLRCSLGSSGFHPQTVRGPSGSPVRALQVRLNRGSTSCTARRGAAAAWARRAIGRRHETAWISRESEPHELELFLEPEEPSAPGSHPPGRTLLSGLMADQYITPIPPPAPARAG